MVKADLDKSVARLIAADSELFEDLAKSASLDPRHDFQDLDLSDVDFGTSDLRQFRFRGSILSGADLSHAKVSHETLADSQIDGAVLPIGYEMQEEPTYFIGLTPDEALALLSGFFTLERAAQAAVTAASFANTDSLKQLAWSRIDTENGYFRDNRTFKSSRVCLDGIANARLREMSLKIQQPRWKALNFLLVQAAKVLLAERIFDDVRFRDCPAFVDGIESELVMVSQELGEPS